MDTTYKYMKQFEQQCPNCSQITFGGSNYCPWCGHKYEAEIAIDFNLRSGENCHALSLKKT